MTQLTKIVQKNRNGERYPWEVKYDVVAKQLALANVRQTSSLTGVPEETIRSWMKADWWPELQKELVAADKMQLSEKLRKITETSLVLVEDRLENGEIVLNQKTGDLIRKPVTALTANRIANDLLDKRLKIQKQQEEQQFRRESTKETLALLAQEFAKWASKARRTDTVNAEDIDYAVHDEREEGLQEGEREVQVQAGANP